MDPERVVNRFFTSGSVTPVEDLVKAIPPQRKAQLLPVIRRRVIQDIIDPLTREVEGTGIVSGKVLEKNFTKQLPTLRAIMNPNQISAMQEFIRAATRSQAAEGLVNPASGRQMLAYGQYLALGGGGLRLLTGQASPTETGMTAIAIASPRAVAWLLTNPGFARLLAKGFTIKPGTAEATAWVPRAANAIRLANNSVKQREKEPIAPPTPTAQTPTLLNPSSRAANLYGARQVNQ